MSKKKHARLAWAPIFILCVLAFLPQWPVTASEATPLEPPPLVWSYQLQATVRSVDFGSILTGGKVGVLAGATDGYIYVFSGYNGQPVSAVNVGDLGADIRFVKVDKFRPGVLDVLVATTKNIAIIDSSWKVVSSGDVSESGVAHFLAYGDARGSGLNSILFYVTATTYPSLSCVVLCSYPFKLYSLPREADLVLAQGKSGQALAMSMFSGLFADVDVDGKDEIFYVGSDGYLYMWSEHSLVWRYKLSGEVGRYFMASSDVDGDNRPDIIVGDPVGNVYALKGTSGVLLWSTTLPQGVVSIATVDVNQDKVSDAILGCADGYVYAVNGANGGKLWNFKVDGYPLVLKTYDLNLDGKQDILVGSGEGQIYAISNEGEKLWVYKAGTVVYDLKVGDVRGDGRQYILFGTKDGKVGLLGPLPSPQGGAKPEQPQPGGPQTEKNFTELEEAYTKLQSDYNSLRDEFDRLKNDYAKLQGDYNALKSDYDTLKTNYYNLMAEYQAKTRSESSGEFTSFLTTYLIITTAIIAILTITTIYFARRAKSSRPSQQ